MEINSKYQKGYNRIKEIFSGSSVWRFLLTEVVYEIKCVSSKYEWCGIYLVKGDMLILETFLGKPTEHSKIKISEGICGASASEKRSIIVEDVSKDNRYISCDLAVKSEIVIPILTQEKIIGVIDIDSNQRNAFLPQDQEFLEMVAKLLASTCPKIHSS
jgi:L-methionine (R)-S-oxide reductase